MAYHSFESLEIWKRGCRLAKLVYEALDGSREFGLRDQMTRATVTAYDPAAMDEAKKEFGNREGLTYAEGPMRALENADALIIVTEWNEFRSPDFDRIKTDLKQPVIFDGRNLYNPAQMRKLDIEHFPIGRK